MNSLLHDYPLLDISWQARILVSSNPIRMAISPVQKTNVSSFENRSFSRDRRRVFLLFRLVTSLTDCQCAMCRISPSSKMPFSMPAVQSSHYMTFMQGSERFAR